MATVKSLLDVARGELGVKESPPNSNLQKYGEWYGWNGVAWCMIFVQWCCAQVGVKLPIRTASCGEMMNAAIKKGMWVTTNFQPGDLVIFDWSGKQTTTNHVGIVEMVLPDYGVQTLEGNTSTSDNSNGGEVMRRRRATKYIIGAVRPVFDKEDEEDMDISKLTDKQAYEIIVKAQRHAAMLPTPDWAKEELQEAIDRGITDGENPMQLIPRYQAAIMAKRG